MRTRKYNLGWAVVYGNSTTAIFHPGSDWMDASEFKKIRITQDNRGLIGLMEVGAGYQTANVVNTPDGAVLLGSTANADGMVYPSDWVDMNDAVKGKQLIRFGRMGKLSSGSTLALANNWLEIESAED